MTTQRSAAGRTLGSYTIGSLFGSSLWIVGLSLYGTPANLFLANMLWKEKKFDQLSQEKRTLDGLFDIYVNAIIIIIAPEELMLNSLWISKKQTLSLLTLAVLFGRK